MRDNKEIMEITVGNKKGIYEKYIKRPQDFIISLVVIIVISPLMLITALIVLFFIGSPVIFKQKRPGYKEKIFTMYKFRTMTNEKDDDNQLLSDAARLTKLGKFLRSTSLDELPEFFNILAGQMSLVGPRPLLVEYLPLYNNKQKRRHSVKPGLTGLAQVRGRNAIAWEEKFESDVEYADNITFWGDWKIIFKTIQKVIVREGINSKTSATKEPFTGTIENKD